MTFPVGAIICYTKCEPCMYGDHFDPPEPHPWAGDEDLKHAQETGGDASGNCGCWCAQEATQ